MFNNSSYSESKLSDENTEINIRNSYISLRVKLSEIISALKEIKKQTKARNLNSAIEMMYFCKPSKEGLAVLGLIITIQRCAKDGNVNPYLNLADLYQRISCD